MIFVMISVYAVWVVCWAVWLVVQAGDDNVSDARKTLLTGVTFGIITGAAILLILTATYWISKELS